MSRFLFSFVFGTVVLVGLPGISAAQHGGMHGGMNGGMHGGMNGGMHGGMHGGFPPGSTHPNMGRPFHEHHSDRFDRRSHRFSDMHMRRRFFDPRLGGGFFDPRSRMGFTPMFFRPY
jgi:hypothetical protein